MGFTARGPQRDLQDPINKVGLKKKKISKFTLMHLGTNEHLWAVMGAHQLEREDMSPSQSRHKTPKERQT